MSSSSAWERTVRAVVVAVLTAGLCAVVPPASGAPAPRPTPGAPRTVDLPPGWSADVDAEGPFLRWRPSSGRTGRTDRYEARLHGRVLAYGYPSTDLRSVVVRLGRHLPRSLADLELWSGGRRVDRAMPSAAGTGASIAAPARSVLDGADPGRSGPYGVTASDYSDGSIAVPGLDGPVEVAGHVVAPVGAPGRRPLVVLLHGWHGTCFQGEAVTAQWPCPSGFAPLPNHLGYDYLQRHLASHGYVTVSVSANGVNAQDNQSTDDWGAAARSAVLRRHLDLWYWWSAGDRAPDGRHWSGHVDVRRVLLVGHSRGREGVVRAVLDRDPASGWDVRGMVLLAPTAFGHQFAPRVHQLVVLPSCDGDVSDLARQRYVDRARDVVGDRSLRSAAFVVGANHNFFNTEWTPGLAAAPAHDDADAGVAACRRGSAQRLGAGTQRSVATTYTTAAAHAFLRGDTGVLALLDGTRVRAPSVAGVDVRTAALGGARVHVRPGLTATVSGAAGAAVRLCEGRAGEEDPGFCGFGQWSGLTPHWPGALPGIPARDAVDLSWQAAGARARLVATSPLDLGRSTHVEGRVVVDPASPSVALRFRLVDTHGNVALLRPRVLTAMPRSQMGSMFVAQTLRARLTDIGDVDVHALRAIELVSVSTTGRVWVLDVAGRRRGLVAVARDTVPRADIADRRVQEGSDGRSVHLRVPVVLDRVPARRVTLSVQAFHPDGELSRQVVHIPAGERVGYAWLPHERDARTSRRTACRSTGCAVSPRATTSGRCGSSTTTRPRRWPSRRCARGRARARRSGGGLGCRIPRSTSPVSWARS
ncbi:MAG: hypothetical protein M3Q27_02025 [Actinomycetota bacterium]|nr:hypothetical protein [Actinomycetota bacterium]